MSKIALSGDASGTGTFTIASPNSNNNRTLTIPDAAGTLALLQTPSFATTIGVGGATPATTGAGITFPATQSASSNANTLDDYEEGTWTPTFVAPGASFTYNVQEGAYVKIGSFVYAQFYIRATAYSGSNANTQIGNLPFNAVNINQFIQHPAALWSTTSIAACPLIDNNAVAANLWKQGPSITIFTASEIIGAYFVGAFLYRTA